MPELSLRSVRHPVIWLGLICVVVFVCAFAACGGNDNTNASSNNKTTTSNSSSRYNGSTTASNGSVSSTGNTTGSSTGANVGTAATVMTISIKETKDAAGKDIFSVDHPTINVKKGDSITIVNQSDDDQDFDEGDASKAGVDVIVPGNHSTTITFNTPGTFAIKSKTGITLNVTVS